MAPTGCLLDSDTVRSTLIMDPCLKMRLSDWNLCAPPTFSGNGPISTTQSGPFSHPQSYTTHLAKLSMPISFGERTSGY
jgi:hypothetical protein